MKYREIIVSDVRNPAYDRHRKYVRVTFGFFGLVFLAIFLFFFSRHTVPLVRFFLRMDTEAVRTPNMALKMVVYRYEQLIGLVGFAGVVAVFGVLAFLAFDMQQRNEVIRKLLKDLDSRSTKGRPGD